VFRRSKNCKKCNFSEHTAEVDKKNTLTSQQEDENCSKPDNFDQFDQNDEPSSQVSPIALTTTTIKEGGGQEVIIKEAIRKAMLDNDGTTNKGYFTEDHFAFELMALPNQHWTYNEAEHLLSQLFQDGKMIEIEPGTEKYKPNSQKELSGSGGG
jgi:hypothetical protein